MKRPEKCTDEMLEWLDQRYNPQFLPPYDLEYSLGAEFPELNWLQALEIIDYWLETRETILTASQEFGRALNNLWITIAHYLGIFDLLEWLGGVLEDKDKE